MDTPLKTDAAEFRAALSIPEFCASYGISRSHFYELIRTGKAPARLVLGRRVLITAESAAAWREQMTR